MGLFRLLIVGVIAATVLGCGNDAPVPEPDDEPTGLTILVTGATGTQGGAVARALLSRGHSVRALTRSPQKPAALGLATRGAVIVQGDFDDAASLDRAMQGVHGVFAVTNFWEHGFDGEVAHGKALIEAAQRAGVSHFVFSSVAGADQQTGLGHFDSKMQIENSLRESGLPHTVLRPVEFMDNWRYSRADLLAGHYRNPRDPAESHQWIAARDIGYFAAEAFDNPAHWLGRTETIAGDQMTLRVLTETMSEVFGKPVAYEQVGWDEFEQTMGEELTDMYRWFSTEGYNANVTALREEHPRLMTVREYLGRLASATGTP